MPEPELPRYNRKTTLRVKVVDKLANWGITVGGLGVVFAVLGLIVFIVWQVFPMFGDARHDPVAEPFDVAPAEVLALHIDEYRRAGIAIDATGTVTTFSAVNGEIIHRHKPPELGVASLTSASITLRSRTMRKVGAMLDVPHFHVLLGTDDGRVFVADLAYVNDFLQYDAGMEPPDLVKLRRPEDDEFTHVDYKADVLVKDGMVIEQLPTFGLYRSIEPRFNLLRRLELSTGGSPVTLLAGQINRAGEDDDRLTTTIVGTADGVTRLVQETIQVNAFTGDMEADTRVTDLTQTLGGRVDFALVNELQDSLLLADREGVVRHFTRRSNRDPFTMPYPALSIFQNQEDEETGKAWRYIVDEQRSIAGYTPIRDPLRLTAMSFLLGDSTVVFGDNRGGVQCWFSVVKGGEGNARLRRIRALEPSRTAIRSISGSPMTKAALVVDETGVRAINSTAERVYLELNLPGARKSIFNRKGDGVLALDGQGHLHHWWVDAPHSEVSWKMLFGKVWYEGHPEPKYEWQSSGGTDDAEPKLSLMPLVMGTIKGAIYALIFAIPLGVLAAIYTSEFMHRNMRAILKPTMEVMASLPSVVLGFLAALYFAPKAAPMMPTLLVACVVVPGVYLLFGWLWQRCPPGFVGRFGRWSSTMLLFLLLALGIWLSSLIGPRAEVFLFPAAEGANPALLHPETFEPLTEQAATELAAGDFRTWTGGGALLPRITEFGGRSLPAGWWVPGGRNLLLAMLTIPLALLLGLGTRRALASLRRKTGTNPFDKLRARLEGEKRAGMRAVSADAAISITFAGLMLAGGFVLALVLAPGLEAAFFSYDHPTAGRVGDFRRFITGDDGWKFEQSNSLIVGFAMGFAVIPLIYTISEDALTTVPNQLRAASLACGASRWQTTIKVVLPAAASGIFSGVVIGLGRALGETMIVVMAAGGTPLMDLQPLEGFRSLSAAIAIEMPEAPHGGTLYRTLFMGGLLLFIMAFTINTLAEIVRMRLRKKLSRL